MKKIITPGVLEEYKLVCNVTGKPAVSKLAMRFGYYGGHRDLQALEVDLCEEVAEDILKLLQSKYPQFQIVDAELLPACPMCGGS